MVVEGTLSPPDSLRAEREPRMKPNRPAYNRSVGAPRPTPPEATPGFAARWAAAQAIGDALTLARPLEERFPGPEGEQGSLGLDARDRALARSIATVAMRRFGTIRKALASLLEKGMPKKAGSLEWILVGAAAQILFLDASDHAAVDLAVRAVRLDPAAAPFTELANAVLRNIARSKAEILAASDPFDDDTPAWLGARWRAAYGEETARAIARAHREEPTLDISVKSDAEGWAARLGGRVLPTGSVRLDSHAPITELDGYADGEWWVQDAAAALPARLLSIAPEERAIDLCAAPGGKCAQLALAGAAVSAVDRSAQRLKRLAGNLARLRTRGRTRRRQRADLRGAAFRRGAARCALHRHRHHSAPPRRRLDQASRKHRHPRQAAGRPARPRGYAHPAGRRDRLLHVLAGARGGRGPDRRAAAPQPRRSPRADRGERDRRHERMHHSARRRPHAALPSARADAEAVRARRLLHRASAAKGIGAGVGAVPPRGESSRAVAIRTHMCECSA